MNTTTARTLLGLALACLAAMPAQAQQGSAVATHQTAWVGNVAASNTSGRIAVNQASGFGNAQANIAAIALSPDGVAQVDVQALQQAGSGEPFGNADTHALIDGSAFAGGHGVMSVNQAAGTSNLQLNVIAIGGAGMVGIARASDAALAATAPAGTSTEGTVTVAPERRAAIDLDAFRGAQGVVQVNQTAGVGNLSTNAIVLLLPGSTP